MVTAVSRVRAWFRTVLKALAKQRYEQFSRSSRLCLHWELVCLYASKQVSRGALALSTHHRSNK